nr:PREDICTED: zinc finger BED domain-containing protein 1-like [Bemisia tabaci]
MTEPNYHVPSADNFASVIIPELYNEKKAELKKTIDEDKDSMSSFSFTTDGWTSKAGDSYLGVTGHYLDDDFYFKNMCLGHEKLNGSHTGVNMKNALQIKLAEYNLIPSTIPIYAVSDNAPNIVNALNLLSSEDVDVTRIPCFDHGLNLAVSDVKEQTKNFSNTCAKTRSLVGFFKHSSSARDVFHEVQIERGLPPLELMQDVPTRWNSEFLMLSRLCKVREPLSIAIGRLKDSPVEDLTTREWSVVESYVNVLRPLYDATVTMSAENKPTISSVIPTLSTVEDILTGIVSTEIGTTPSKTLAKNLKLQIQSRFPNYTEDKIYVISMMLDPRYKDMLIDSSKKNRWVEVIKTEANKMAEALAEKAKKASQVTATPSTSQVNAPSSSTTPATSLRASMKRVLSQKTSQSEMSVKSLLDLELGHYFAEAPIGLDDDPLKFWRESRSKYPLLRPVAKKYLGIPASQCACERQNSTGTNVVTARRRRLTPLHVEQLVFLHENL